MPAARTAAQTQTTSEQLINPTPALPVTGETVTYLGGGSVIAALLLVWLRRRLSRDGSQIVQDRSEGMTVKMLLDVNKALAAENERVKNDAREAWGQRTKDAAHIAMLEERNTNLQRELDRLQPAILTATAALIELKDSGIAPLVDLKQPPKGK